MKDTIKRMKDNPQAGRKCLPNTYLVKDLYPKCIQNSYNSAIRKKKKKPWQVSIWKDTQHMSSENCKMKQ